MHTHTWIGLPEEKVFGKRIRWACSTCGEAK
jgi:hypothetical protein